MFKRNLPTEEQWNTIVQNIEEHGLKLLMIHRVTWHNALTRRKQTIENMPVMAISNNGDRPKAILKIEIYKKDSNGNYKTQNTYHFHEYYSHINLSSDTSSHNVVISDDMTYRVTYQSICSPITAHHLYKKDKKEMELIFIGQLSGQNPNSAFQSIQHTNNVEKDFALKFNGGSGFIKANQAPLILLIKYPGETLRTWSTAQIKEQLERQVPGIMAMKPTDKAIKLKDTNAYTIESAEDAARYEEAGEISDYYPILTKGQIDGILTTLPKDEIDFACLGLGSAGTGILDQIANSTYFKSYLLVDNDYIEPKNIRNQWYGKSNVRNSKVMASKTELMDKACNNDLQVLCHSKLFQKVGMQNYICKYIVSGFDSIEARAELLEYIKDGRATTKYLIDTRYDDLTSSLYFIDTENEKELKYYEKNLKADLEAFKELESKKEKEPRFIETDEEFMEWLEEQRAFVSECGPVTKMIASGYSGGCGCETDCRGDACIKRWLKLFHEHKPKIVTDKDPMSSCVKQNFIDIYKFTSAFVFSAIREIESGNDKPFIHVELQTEKIPSFKVMR